MINEIDIQRVTKITLPHGQIITIMTEDEPKLIEALTNKGFMPLSIPSVQSSKVDKH